MIGPASPLQGLEDEERLDLLATPGVEQLEDVFEQPVAPDCRLVDCAAGLSVVAKVGEEPCLRIKTVGPLGFIHVGDQDDKGRVADFPRTPDVRLWPEARNVVDSLSVLEPKKTIELILGGLPPLRVSVRGVNTQKARLRPGAVRALFHRPVGRITRKAAPRRRRSSTSIPPPMLLSRSRANVRPIPGAFSRVVKWGSKTNLLAAAGIGGPLFSKQETVLQDPDPQHAGGRHLPEPEQGVVKDDRENLFHDGKVAQRARGAVRDELVVDLALPDLIGEECSQRPRRKLRGRAAPCGEPPADARGDRVAP